jgi:Protein of unknown function (DUF1203)
MTTTTRTARYQVHALPSEALDRVRSTGVDASGAAVVRVRAEGYEPLRCCLRTARADEDCLLFNYEPGLPAASPYREVGAVFAHAMPCQGPASDEDYPSEWLGRPQVLRAYDDRGWIHPSTRVHDGTDPLTVIDEMLSDPAVVAIHSRNIAYGCYMFTVTR